LALLLLLLQVMTICKILEGILPKESVRGAPPPDKKLLEYHFVFACVWAFGGCMLVDKVSSNAHFCLFRCCLDQQCRKNTLYTLVHEEAPDDG
jgi:hypothetical protein